MKTLIIFFILMIFLSLNVNAIIMWRNDTSVGIANGNFASAPSVPVNSGDLIVLSIHRNNGTTMTIEDNQSNVYTTHVFVAGDRNITILSAIAQFSSELVVNVTTSANSRIGLIVSIFNGTDETSSRFDVSNISAGSGTNPMSENITTTVADDLLVGSVGCSNTCSASLGTGWSNLEQNTDGRTAFESKVVSGTVTDFSNFTTASVTWATAIGSFKPAPSNTPPQWSSNSTNSTIAGTVINHTVVWADDVALSGYIFSFCNGSYSSISTTQNYYNFTDSTNNKAYNSSQAGQSIWNGLEANAGAYSNLQTRNSAYAVVTSTGSNFEPKWRFNFTINEATADINWIYIEWTGFDNAAETGTVYVWNYTSSALVSIGTTPSTNGNITRNYTGSTNASQLVSSGNNQLVVYVEGANYDSPSDAISVDFVQVTVNADSTTSGVCYEANPKFTNDTFVSFTGVSNQSSVLKFVNQTVGSSIAWRIYTNDSLNQWNVTGIFKYNTTTSAPTNCWTVSAGKIIIPPTCRFEINTNQGFN